MLEALATISSKSTTFIGRRALYSALENLGEAIELYL